MRIAWLGPLLLTCIGVMVIAGCGDDAPTTTAPPEPPAVEEPAEVRAAANLEALRVAREMAEAEGRDYAGAAAYVEKHGDPDAPEWDAIEEALLRWWHFDVVQRQQERQTEASSWLSNNVTRRTATPAFRPVDALSDQEVAEQLAAFFRDYPDARDVPRIIEGAAVEPYKTFARILREHPFDESTSSEILAGIDERARVLVEAKRYGDAIAPHATLETLVPGSKQRRVELLEAARKAFDEDMLEVRRLIGAGRPGKARLELLRMIDAYGLDVLLQEAVTALDGLR